MWNAAILQESCVGKRQKVEEVFVGRPKFPDPAGVWGLGEGGEGHPHGFAVWSVGGCAWEGPYIAIIKCECRLIEERKNWRAFLKGTQGGMESVCPIVDIGSPHPLSRILACLPL